MTTRWLTLRDVAEHLGIHRSTVYELVHKGQLPATRVGIGDKSAIRVSERDLEAYLERRRLPVTPKDTTPAARTRAQECRELGIEPEHEFIS
jgi:excisionase family DNA binding protein